jgi:sulfur-oxidizing protein SoxY
MPEGSPATGPTRRDLWLTAVAGLATATMPSPSRASDEAVELIERLTGKTPTESDRLHLVMPRTFPNGYTVPLSLEVDGPGAENDHVRNVRVVAPPCDGERPARFHLGRGRRRRLFIGATTRGDLMLAPRFSSADV